MSKNIDLTHCDTHTNTVFRGLPIPICTVPDLGDSRSYTKFRQCGSPVCTCLPLPDNTCQPAQIQGKMVSL